MARANGRAAPAPKRMPANARGNAGRARRLRQAQPAAQRLSPQHKATISQMIQAQMKSIPRGPAAGQDTVAMYRAALRSAQFAPRGHGYYDAFNNRCEHVLLGAAVGPATCIHGVTLTTIPSTPKRTGSYEYGSGEVALNATLTTNKKLVIFNPSSSDNTLGVVISFDNDPNDSSKIVAVITQLLTATQFALLGPSLKHSTIEASYIDGNALQTSTDPADRVESIPLRGSLRIKNVTESISVGGSVRVLRYNGSVRYWKDPIGDAGQDIVNGSSNFNTPDVATVLQLCDMIENSERTRHYSAKELLVRHQVNTHPADFIRATTFEQDVHFDECIQRTRYNTVMILIDDFTSSQGALSNTYEISAQVHRAGRFAPGTLLHAKSQELKANPAAHSQAAYEESVKGSAMYKAVLDRADKRIGDNVGMA